jgi:hypothetical protein
MATGFLRAIADLVSPVATAIGAPDLGPRRPRRLSAERRVERRPVPHAAAPPDLEQRFRQQTPHSAQNFLPGIPSVPHFEQRILCS